MNSLFQLLDRCPKTRARRGLLRVGGAVVETPIFMPVGTLGTVKAMTPQEVAAIGYRLILANTFHLELRPGSELVKRLGGLHKFMNWPHALLTDSGGYQVFSLATMRKITEEGAEFRSPYDGALCKLTPERAIQIQLNLGSDIIMPLDECLEYGAERARAEKSLALTLRWLERCKKEWEKGARDEGTEGPGRNPVFPSAEDVPEIAPVPNPLVPQSLAPSPSLFGICQGGFFPDLRERSAEATAALELPGHSIGGLSVGEPENEMMDMLDASIGKLPEGKPRYAMGIGLPLNLIDMVMRGVDMFDCVVPTRNARNGRVYTFEGIVILKHAANAEDSRPLEDDCPCDGCRNYSRAYLRHLYMSNEILAARLATLHNLTFFWRLMERVRAAIPTGGLPALRAEIAARYAASEKEPAE